MKPEGVQPLVAGQARLLPNIVAETVKRFNAKMIEEEKPAKQIFSSLEDLLKVATPKKPDVNSTYFNEEYVDRDREYFLLSYGEIFRVNDPYRLYVHMEMVVKDYWGTLYPQEFANAFVREYNAKIGFPGWGPK